MEINKETEESMSRLAWMARDRAHIYGKTKAGACVLTEHGGLFTGCNIEHIYRTRDIHAEQAAIVCAVVGGCPKIKAIIVVAERDNFIPCGSCMDWIHQHGGGECLIGQQNKIGGEIKWYKFTDLMPQYPS